MRRLLAALALASLSALPAHAAWYEAASDHFLVYSEGSEAVVRDVATRLERYDRGMRYLRNTEDYASNRSNRLKVYVLANVAAIRRLYGGKDQFVAGFYQPRASGSVAFTPRRSGGDSPYDLKAETVLFHEYAHHFLFGNYAAAYPGWFIEGFAEFNSTATFDRDGSLGFGRPALHRAQGLMRGVKLPLATMFASGAMKLNPQQRESFYARGWLLTHYLTFAEARSGQLRRYLQLINEGKRGEEAARTAFGDVKQLEREIDRYLMSARMVYYRLPADKTPAGEIKVRMLGAGEAAMMPVRMRSDRGVSATTAPLVAADARRLAAPYASDPVVQGWLAEAEFDAGNDDAAEAAADRALAAAPDHVQALVYKGEVRMRRAVAARSTDPVVWKDVRSWFIKANKPDPDAAWPLVLFYRSFVAAGMEPTRNAVLGLTHAFELAPQDYGVRMDMVRQHVLDGDVPAARRALMPIAFNPHANPDNPAATLLALLDEGKAGRDALVEADRRTAAKGAGMPAGTN